VNTSSSLGESNLTNLCLYCLWWLRIYGVAGKSCRYFLFDIGKVFNRNIVSCFIVVDCRPAADCVDRLRVIVNR